MDLLENEDKDSVITPQDFPSICRICCMKRLDSRPLEEEAHLFDLFHAIRKTDVNSRVDFPDNVCNGCIKELEDISLFIDIPNKNKTSFGKDLQPKKKIESSGDIGSEMSGESIGKTEEKCRICPSSASLLTPFERKTYLIQLFHNVTNTTDVNSETNSSKTDHICDKCNEQLEKISLFVSSSLLNDQKLENASIIKNSTTIEKCTNPIKTDSSACEDWKLASVIGTSETKTEDISNGNSCFRGRGEEVENIFIKEETTDSSQLQFDSQTFPEETPFEWVSVKNESLDGGSYTEGDPITQSMAKTFKCNRCDKAFTRNFHLRRHMLIHSGRKPFKCDFCERSFRHKPTLKSHLLIHTGEKPFKCDRCEKIFSKKFTLKCHMLTHTKERPFECNYCERSFTLKQSFKSHLASHTRENPFKCNRCDGSFRRRSDLRLHLLTHTEEKPFKCDCCCESFSQKKELREHLLTHAEEKSFKCDRCGEGFRQASTLRSHFLTHTGEKPFKCETCEESFRQKSTLRAHLLTHTEEKPFACVRCIKSFKSKQSLRRHSLSHLEEKPFKCDSCEERFSSASNLRWHSLSHTEERPFKCGSCDKSFKCKKNLPRHMLTHTDEKPFKCDLCDKSFTLKQSLKNHSVIHAGEKPFELD